MTFANLVVYVLVGVCIQQPILLVVNRISVSVPEFLPLIDFLDDSTYFLTSVLFKSLNVYFVGFFFLSSHGLGLLAFLGVVVNVV